MTWEPRPVPDATPETTTYWEGAAEGRLLVTKCRECELVSHPPRSYCPDCLGETEWIESEGRGTIYSYTIVRQHWDWPDEYMPAIIAYVELLDGPTMMAGLIDVEPESVSIGASVHVDFVATDDDAIGIPVFKLDD